jgi:N-acetylmuramoyl-L-alanine amidase
VLDDPRSFQSAIGQYEFLRREYPGSRYRFDALFSIAEIYRQNLNDEGKARENYGEFLKHYPRHHLAEQARAALVEMDEQAELAKHPAPKGKSSEAAKMRKQSRQPVEENADDDAEKPAVPVAQKGSLKHVSGRLPLVTGVRHWSTPDYTRIAIDLEDEVKYEAGRVPSPDRIFFDLHGTKLASELVGKSFDVQDGFLRRIRVAQFSQSLTRVVLEVDDVSEYSAFLLPNPYRLIIDIHGKKAAAAQTQIAAAQAVNELKKADAAQAAEAKTETRNEARNAPASNDARGVITFKVTPDKSAKKSAPSGAQAEDSATKKAETGDAGEMTASEVAALSAHPGEVKATDKPTSEPTVEKVAPREGVTVIAGSKAQNAGVTVTANGKASPANSPDSDDNPDAKAEMKAEAKPPVAPAGKRRAGKRPAVSEVASIHEAAPNASGDRSLIRALGLKIGKIVVDAGHGGHDTGTIGPNGLMEKDLVLDVALRLGKELEQKLGAEVVYTRDDDTFIPLETRTAIANQNQADLFISIHANSSDDAGARGVETYYLNFTSSADALDVAARENAVSQTSIHELQDLVKKIALKEKIDESREFAVDVQQSLHTGLAAKSPAIKDRGVKKAPFIVLIGANMPSILAEISFVSNPSDEKKLKTPDYRQKIADSLYHGVARYVNSLSSVKVASAASAPAAP